MTSLPAAKKPIEEFHAEKLPAKKLLSLSAMKSLSAVALIYYNEPASYRKVSCGEALCGEGSRDEIAEAAMRDKHFQYKGVHVYSKSL